ncbi:MAG: hypothetical protein ACYDH2_17145, partial [Anaerolineaceae bacterium]
NNKLKELKQILKDELEGSKQYQDIMESIVKLTEEKKAIINQVMDDNSKTVQEIEDLTIDLKNQKQLVSDVALKDYLAGEEVKVIKNHKIYAPVFSCKFVKTGEVDFPEKLNSK